MIFVPYINKETDDGGLVTINANYGSTASETPDWTINYNNTTLIALINKVIKPYVMDLASKYIVNNEFKESMVLDFSIDGMNGMIDIDYLCAIDSLGLGIYVKSLLMVFDSEYLGNVEYCITGIMKNYIKDYYTIEEQIFRIPGSVDKKFELFLNRMKNMSDKHSNEIRYKYIVGLNSSYTDTSYNENKLEVIKNEFSIITDVNKNIEYKYVMTPEAIATEFKIKLLTKVMNWDISWEEMIKSDDQVRNIIDRQLECSQIQDRVNDIKSILQNKKPQYLFIQGESGVGKTNLAVQIFHDINSRKNNDDDLSYEDYICIPLFDLESDSRKSIQEILINRLEIASNIDFKKDYGSYWDSKSLEKLTNIISQEMEKVKEKDGRFSNKRIIFIFDNAAEIFRQKAVFSFFRNMSEHFVFIMTSYNEMNQNLKEFRDMIQYEEYAINKFSEEQTRFIFIQRIDNQVIEYDNIIYEKTKGLGIYLDCIINDIKNKPINVWNTYFHALPDRYNEYMSIKFSDVLDIRDDNSLRETLLNIISIMGAHEPSDSIISREFIQQLYCKADRYYPEKIDPALKRLVDFGIVIQNADRDYSFYHHTFKQYLISFQYPTVNEAKEKYLKLLRNYRDYVDINNSSEIWKNISGYMADYVNKWNAWELLEEVICDILSENNYNEYKRYQPILVNALFYLIRYNSNEFENIVDKYKNAHNQKYEERTRLKNCLRKAFEKMAPGSTYFEKVYHYIDKYNLINYDKDLMDNLSLINPKTQALSCFNVGDLAINMAEHHSSIGKMTESNGVLIQNIQEIINKLRVLGIEQWRKGIEHIKEKELAKTDQDWYILIIIYYGKLFTYLPRIGKQEILNENKEEGLKYFKWFVQERNNFDEMKRNLENYSNNDAFKSMLMLSVQIDNLVEIQMDAIDYYEIFQSLEEE